MVNKLPVFTLPLDFDYLVIEIDNWESGWEGTLSRKISKYNPKNSESIYRYA